MQVLGALVRAVVFLVCLCSAPLALCQTPPKQAGVGNVFVPPAKEAPLHVTQGPTDIALSNLDACYGRSLTRLGKTTADIDTLWQVSALCYRESIYAYRRTELEVRRASYQQAQTQSDAILRLVVGMTWGGIALASLQLAFVFALSWRERKLLMDGSELTAESNRDSSKLYFRSSVVGLMILVITFAFFYLYAIDIYPVTDKASRTDPALDKAENGQMYATRSANSEMGRLDESDAPSSALPSMGRLDSPDVSNAPSSDSSFGSKKKTQTQSHLHHTERYVQNTKGSIRCRPAQKE
jgi:hypothetical protein